MSAVPKKNSIPVGRPASSDALPIEDSTGISDPIVQIRNAEKKAENLLQHARLEAQQTIQEAHEQAGDDHRRALEQADRQARKDCDTIHHQAEAQIRALERETKDQVTALRDRAQPHFQQALSMILRNGAIQK